MNDLSKLLEGRRWRRGRLWRAPPLALAVTLVFAGPLSMPRAETTAAPDPVASRPVAVGEYLAARFADSANDSRAAIKHYLAVLEHNPDNLALLRRALSLAVRGGEMKQALVLADRLKANAASSAIAGLLQVLRDTRDGHYAAALKELDGPEGNGFNQLLETVVRAWVLAGQKKFSEALGALDKMKSQRALGRFRDYHAALLLDFAGRPAKAEVAYQAVVDRGEASTRTILAYGNFLARQGRRDDEKALYDEFLAKFPGSPLIAAAEAAIAGRKKPVARLVGSPAAGIAEGLFFTAQALSPGTGRAASVIYLRLALFLRPDFDDGRFLLGNVLENVGLPGDAIEEYTRIGSRSPLHWLASLQLAAAYNALDRQPEAIKVLDGLIAKKPDDVQALTMMGNVRRESEDYSAAVKFYDRAIAASGEFSASHWVLFYTRGIAYEQTDRWDLAEKDFQRALELQPNQPLVLNYLGYSWIDQNRNFDKASEMIEKAAELRPNDGYIVDSLGWSRYRLGAYEEAVETLERAVLLQPEDPTINDHLGDAYWKVGRFREARFQWQHALARDPDAKQAIAIRDKLQAGLVTVKNLEPR